MTSKGFEKVLKAVAQRAILALLLHFGYHVTQLLALFFVGVGVAADDPSLLGRVIFNGASLEEQVAHGAHAICVSEAHDLGQRGDVVANDDIWVSSRVQEFLEILSRIPGWLKLTEQRGGVDGIFRIWNGMAGEAVGEPCVSRA